MTALSWDRQQGHATGYDVVERGFNYRIDEPRAALASARLVRLDAENARRHAIDAQYRIRLAELGVESPLGPADGLEQAHHLFCMLFGGEGRQTFRDELAGRGIQTSMHYPPVHRFSIYADGAPPLPATELYAEQTVTLPMFAHMSEEQHGLVLEAVAAALPLTAA
jgi:dTDP-4-amino-4,6-dideoxygalactose transaminase